jgi:hypothetical protein
MMIIGSTPGLQVIGRWAADLFASGWAGRLLAACTVCLFLGAPSYLRGQSASANGE